MLGQQQFALGSVGNSQLRERKIPAGAGAHIDVLLTWCTPRLRGQKQVTYSDCPSPDIYAVHHKGGTRLVSDMEEPDGAVARFSVCRKTLDEDGVARFDAAYLDVPHLFTLAHLVSVFSAPDADVDVASFDDHNVALSFRPSFLRQRLGRSLSSYGEQLDVIESQLSDLALLHVQHQIRKGNEWVTQSTAPLLSGFVNGGRRDVLNGQPTRVYEKGVVGSSRQYRHTRWQLQFGSPLLEMMRLAGVSNWVALPSHYGSLTRSGISRWLLLFFAGHGYDAGHIHPYKVGTLAKRAFPQLRQQIENKPKPPSSRRGAAQSAFVRLRDILDIQGNIRRSVASFARRIRSGLTRLQEVGFFQRCSFTGAINDPDALASLQRTPAAIEHSVDLIPRRIQASNLYKRLLSAITKRANPLMDSGIAAELRSITSMATNTGAGWGYFISQRFKRLVSNALSYSQFTWKPHSGGWPSPFI